MGQLTVDPGSLDTASAALRCEQVDGLTMLARAIIDDVRDGDGNTGTDGLGSALPELAAAIAEQTRVVADHLSTAAGGYRLTEWLVRIASAER